MEQSKMNDMDDIGELARYFTLLDPGERLSFFRSWFTGLVEERGHRGRKLVTRFYNQLEDVYLDSDGKLSDWMKKKLIKNMGLTPTEVAEEAYRARKLRQVAYSDANRPGIPKQTDHPLGRVSDAG